MEALRVNPTDRKRLFAASALTLLALPLLLNENRENEREPSLAVVSPDAGIASQLQTGAVSATTGSVAPQSTATTVAPSLPEIRSAADITAPQTPAASLAVPVMQGEATWDRWAPAEVGTTTPCATPLAPLGQQVTVTNLDNGRSITCVVVDQATLPVHVVVKLDAALFQSLADLGESPIPVRLTI